MTCAAPGATANTANCGNAVGDLTDVGGYTGSASPNGTFGQGGNVWEWNDTLFGGPYRGLWGGSFGNSPDALAASYGGSIPADVEDYIIGFGVASSVPPVPTLGPIGLFLVAAGLLGFGAYRRGRA